MKFVAKSDTQKLWRNYVRDKNSTTWLQYTKQRNKVKRIVRNDLKEKQNLISQQYKSNPKKFWKYVNTKTKRTETIGDLKVKNELGETIVCTSAKSKADSLCSFLVVFL